MLKFDTREYLEDRNGRQLKTEPYHTIIHFLLITLNSTKPLLVKNICIGDSIFCAVPVSNLFFI